MPSAHAQDQPQILPQPSKPLQDHLGQQDVSNIIQSISVESTNQSLPKPPDNSDVYHMIGVTRDGCVSTCFVVLEPTVAYHYLSFCTALYKYPQL